MAVPRFCPFCGQTNAPEYAFCQRCGRALPPPVGSVLPVANLPIGPPLPFAPPPPAEPPSFDDGPFERPLTDAERFALRGSRRARQGNMARVFGTLTGIVPPFFVLMSILGTPFVALNYVIIITVAGFLGLILGRASFALRSPVSIALRASQITEARGVPEKRPGPGGMVSVDLGGVDLLVKAKLAGRLLDGRMNAIAFVLVGPSGPRHADRARAAIVAVNGDASSPEDAYVLVPPEVLHSLRPGKRAAMARKR